LAIFSYAIAFTESESPVGVIRRPTIAMPDFVPSVMVGIRVGGVLIGQNDKASAAAILEGHKSGTAIVSAYADLLAECLGFV
jgi:hypothetical protein